jgi:hypothetical protein
MDTTVAVKASSGQIYRMKIMKGWQELPQSPGIYCFMFPQSHPGAPIRPFYWGQASFDLRIETRDDNLRREAIRQGAKLIGVVPMDGMVARRRAMADLLSSFPAPMNDEEQETPQRKRTRTSTNHRRSV